MQESPAALVQATVASVASVSEAYTGERQREIQRELSCQGVRRQAKWVYLSKDMIDARSPSRKDGLLASKEAVWRREFHHLIKTAGMNLKVPIWVIADAALLCHRFFSRKSMKRNDRFVVAAACLHLAGKMGESPKQIREVVKECEKIRHSKNVQVLKKLNDPAYLEKAKEEVLMAERAVLYTLGFELNISHPYTFLMRQFTSLQLQSQEPFRHVMQNTWNFINDSYRTTLCIQFPPEKLAYAALFLANEVNKFGDHGQGIEEVLKSKSADKMCDFYTYFDITCEEVTAITDQMLSLYEESKTTQLAKVLPAHAAMPPQQGPHHASPMMPPPLRPGQARLAPQTPPSYPEVDLVGNSMGVKRKAEDDMTQPRTR